MIKEINKLYFDQKVRLSQLFYGTHSLDMKNNGFLNN